MPANRQCMRQTEMLMAITKDELRKKFTAEWEKHYKIKSLIDRGYKRKLCPKCGKNFWSIVERETCADSSCVGYQFIGAAPSQKKLDYIETWKLVEKYFATSGHTPITPYPTVARWRDDLYFTVASINDFQPYVVNGEIDPPANPLIVPQPCIRFSDIDNVGVTGRHSTNFVMIGQHAFNTKKTGQFYWKEEAIAHDINNLMNLGIPEEEIVFTEDVWMGGGNFGPSIEYFSRGLELGNCVFMQYKITKEGPSELDTKVIDMGAGLSRFTWITHGSPTSYEHIYGPVIGKMKQRADAKIDNDLFLRYAKMSGTLNNDETEDIEGEKARIAKELGADKDELFGKLEPLQALYASADHLCTILFTSTDGMLPSNAGGGYNLRMILRRVFGFNDKLDLRLDYAQIIEGHAAYLKPLFPHLSEGATTAIDVTAEEERKYRNQQEKAKGKVSNLVSKAQKEGRKVTAKELITAYQSDGISPEMVRELAGDGADAVEIPANFYALARTADETGAEEAKDDLSEYEKTGVLYYEPKAEFTAKVIGKRGNKVILDKTAFYPESGGQTYDTGTMNGKKVINVQKDAGVILHELSQKDADAIIIGDDARCSIDMARRKQVTKHHTGAHILNAAARHVLGPHVWQGGSHKDEAKAHLDITHYRKISQEELDAIEAKANEIISMDLPIRTQVLPRTQAEKQYGFRLYQGGAVPGRELRIVSVGDMDHEACGGTHFMLKTTGEIGVFKIVKREGIQDGIERITYKCGPAAIEYIQSRERLIKDSAAGLGIDEAQLPKATMKFFNDWKDMGKRLDAALELMAKGIAARIAMEHAKSGETVYAFCDQEEDVLRKAAMIVAESGKASCVLVNQANSIVCASGKDALVGASDLLKQMTQQHGGGGGGSAKIAQGRLAKKPDMKLSI